MKTNKSLVLVALLAAMSLSLSAQQVNTVYFLENAPMRHTFNPAFQPVSNGFLNFTPLGWTSMSFGNNSLTLSDVLFVDPATGKTITPLYPSNDPNNPRARRDAFLRSMHSMTNAGGDVTLGLINLGVRLNDAAYLTIGINERIEMGGTTPKSLYQFLIGGGMTNLEPGAVNSFNLTGLGLNASAYTEIGAGYSHKLNDQWTLGGKFKLLLGQMHVGFNSQVLNIDASTDQWNLRGKLNLEMAGPINFNKLPVIENRSVGDIIREFTNNNQQNATTAPQNEGINIREVFDTSIPALLTPHGVGAAIDFGFTYKPIENLQVSAAINDLGFIYWTNARKYSASVDTVFTGVGEFNVDDPAFKDEQGNFSTQLLLDSALNGLSRMADAVKLGGGRNGYAKMVSARLNIGLDANFWDNRVGIGILSATRLYNARLYEEVTIGAAFRPVNWFNIAVSYSLMNNGKYSNIGAGLSFMPYDGINMTLALDYIPTSYAAIDINGTPKYLIPDKAKMLNVAFGFSICWGSNRKDSDHDGVWDKIDMCPETPRGVQVDSVGCPLDGDHDGVPDYLDHCPDTRPEAIAFIDSVGCDKDSDGDGVPDYIDKCPDTPKEAWGKVDSVGCPLDTDLDGVPDYKDECPDTKPEARNFVDEKGCDKDSDLDGVPDYRDECPDTPEEARATVDEKGCPKDTDQDGVPDFKDECPDTKPEARNFVDEKGCDKDTDGDGVPDYKDECPLVPGVKANKGCPEIKREVRQLLQKAMQGIEFETGKSTIRKKSYPLLDQIAKVFIENSNYIIEVQGHTDNVGKADYNMKLSDDRANSVRNYLISKGVESTRMTANGYGLTQPIADNKTKAGRQKNRRVEFKISFEEVHYETILDHADPEPAPAPEQPASEQAAPTEATPAQ